MTEAVDVVVVGAGVVGLAIAEALSAAGLRVLILDGEARFGEWTSSRNSEVIHAGLYYPHGSLKHRTCIRGRELLYAFCRAASVPHRNCGKLVVAPEPEMIGDLEALHAMALANGVPVTMLDRREVGRIAPDLRASAAIASPTTGIIDSHGYMQALLGRAEARGAMLVCHTRVTAIARGDDRTGGPWHVSIAGEAEPVVAARWIVNAAGLGAQAVSRAIEGMPAATVPPLFHARGRYCAYAGKAPFDRLIYPLPEPGGLGVHLTLDMAGQARFGPDVSWVDGIDYTVDGIDVAAFARAVRAWWPGVDAAKLTPGYAGVRPKLSGPGEPAADFAIDGPDKHGLPGVVALYGIESPGLTASLALAEIVQGIIREHDR